MKKERIKIIPIGGLGEVGKNMMVIEYKNEIIIVDCGLMFPKSKHYGVNSIHNDLSYVKNNIEKVKGIIITHGHLDHIGGIARLLKEINIPVYCNEFTKKTY